MYIQKNVINKADGKLFFFSKEFFLKIQHPFMPVLQKETI